MKPQKYLRKEISNFALESLLKFDTKLHSFCYRFKRMRLAEQLQKRSDNLNNLNSLEDGEGENETGIDGR